MEINYPDLVGLTVGAACRRINNEGFDYRIVREDGEHFIVTEDYRTDRINLEVDQHKVTKAYVG